MNEDELKKLWKGQAAPDPAAEDPVEQMKRKTRHMNRILFWRDTREIVVCAAISTWFGADLWFENFTRTLTWLGLNIPHENTTLTRIGDGVLALSGVWIAGRLLAARRTNHTDSNQSSVREFITAEIAKLDQQIRMLRTAWWWYLFPVFSGVFLIVLGATNPPDRAASGAVMAVVFAAAGAVTQWANRYAARKTLLPLKQELERTMEGMR